MCVNNKDIYISINYYIKITAFKYNNAIIIMQLLSKLLLINIIIIIIYIYMMIKCILLD